MREIIVIGGGAAGMMAAYSAAAAGADVTLLEQNEKLGKKLFITGKGRCNVCNATEDREELFGNLVTNRKFLYSAFACWDARAMMELLQKAGCPLKIERGERVFPVSDHSSDVIGTLKRLLDRAGVRICLGAQVQKIECAENRFRSVLLTDGRKVPGDACILCTGGVSYASTGSTGDGYRFAGQLGHEIVPAKPALVPLETVQEWPREVMGLSLKNVSLKLLRGKKILYEGFGEMMFTHFGITGPLVLSASSYFWAKKPEGETTAVLDLKPALTLEQLDKRLLRDFEENRAKQFRNALGGLFPAKLIPVMISLSGIAPEKKVSEISREERLRFAGLIKALPLTIKGTRGFEEAIITQGGISVKQVNPSTMESRLTENLYFAGEVLDLDALTGGFNLQIAWSTGYLAGRCAARKGEEDEL